MTVKIGFVLLSGTKHPIPSTRIAVLNMLPFLRTAGFDPQIVFDPVDNNETPDVSGLAARLQAERFQIVYFQKVHGDSVLALVKSLRAAGIRTVFGVCDLVDVAMADTTDATITVTDYLKSLYPTRLHCKMAVVHDGIEKPDLYKTQWGSHRGSRSQPLRAVLVTSASLDRLPVLQSPPDWLHVSIVGQYPAKSDHQQRFREARWNFVQQPNWAERLRYVRFLTQSGVDCVQWRADRVYQALLDADIGIIPIETDASYGALPGWQVKSENRLTLKMAMGLPVIATPIPAYEPVIVQGQNGFLAKGRADWLNCLAALRDPVLRQTMGQHARRTALDGYSMERQAQRLISVLRGLVSQDSVC